jgi:hypothetical protein
MKMARHFQQEPLAARIFQLMEARMEAILRSQDVALERQQHEQEQAQRKAARQRREARAVESDEEQEQVSLPPQQQQKQPQALATARPVAASPAKKYSSLAQVKKGIKRSRVAAEAIKLSAASDSAKGPPAKKTARKAPVNPFMKKSVASPQKPRRAQDVLNQLAGSPGPKPVLGRQSSAVQDIIKKGKDKKLF